MSHVVGNRDKCGRCNTKHGGNNHLCPVHGPVSQNCCEPVCKPEDWQQVVYLYKPNNRGGSDLIRDHVYDPKEYIYLSQGTVVWERI